MSLQDLELSPFLASELYRDTLVTVKTGETIEEIPIPTKTKPAEELSGYVPANTSAIGLPPVTSKPPEPTSTTQLFTEPAMEKPKPVQQEQSGNRNIKFLGGNKKNIAFIVNCTTDVFLPEKHLDWLGKMLEACRLNLGDVAIANIANNQFTITDIKNELQSNTVILLGTEPFAIQLPINFPHFNQQPYADIMFLYTPGPDQMNQSTHEAKVLKSKLWVSLQKLFKL